MTPCFDFVNEAPYHKTIPLGYRLLCENNLLDWIKDFEPGFGGFQLSKNTHVLFMKNAMEMHDLTGSQFGNTMRMLQEISLKGVAHFETQWRM